MVFSRLAQRTVSPAAAVMLVISAVAIGVAAPAPIASAAGTVLFNQPFHDNTVDGPAGSVSLPTAPTGTNAACLSASGNLFRNPLASCSAPNDAQGSGRLRFTPALTSQEGGVFASTSVPTSQGLDVTWVWLFWSELRFAVVLVRFWRGCVLVRLPFRMVLMCEIRDGGREASGGTVRAG